MRALQPAAKSKGGVLMPVCGVCVGPGHPAGQSGSPGLTRMQESRGLRRCSHHPALRSAHPLAWALPCSSTAAGLCRLIWSPALACPQKPGQPPKPRGFHVSAHLALLAAVGAAGDRGAPRQNATRPVLYVTECL